MSTDERLARLERIVQLQAEQIEQMRAEINRLKFEVECADSTVDVVKAKQQADEAHALALAAIGLSQV